MSIIHNGHKITAIYRGDTPIARVLRGEDTLFQAEEDTPVPTTFSLSTDGKTITVNGANKWLRGNKYGIYVFRYGSFFSRYRSQQHNWVISGWRANGIVSLNLDAKNRICFHDDAARDLRWQVCDMYHLVQKVPGFIRDTGYMIHSWGFGDTYAYDKDRYGNDRELSFKCAVAIGLKSLKDGLTKIEPEMMATELVPFNIIVPIGADRAKVVIP